MNIEILEILMKQKKIPSYFQLANRSGIPYTTLLDLVHGKSTNLQNIKFLSDYFQVEFTMLSKNTEYYCVVTEENKMQSYLFFHPIGSFTALVSLLLDTN